MTVSEFLAAGDPLIRSCELIRVRDGDTFDGRIVLWPSPRLEQTWGVRVLGCNAPDVGEGGHAEAARELAGILSVGPITLQAIRADKYGDRIDAVVVVRSPTGPVVVADALIAAGVAVAWDGRGERPLVPWPPASGPYAARPVDDPDRAVGQ